MTTTPIDYASPDSLTQPRLDWRNLLAKLGPLIGLIFVYLLFTILVKVVPASWNAAPFATADNFALMLRQTSVVGIAALGMTMIIISGGIDLSPGSNLALCAVVIALALSGDLGQMMRDVIGFGFGTGPWSATASAIAGVITAAIVGFLIGAMVVGSVGRVAAVAIGLILHIALHQAAGWPLWLSGLVGLVVAAGAWVFNDWTIKRLELSPFIVTLGLWGGLRGAAKGLGNNQAVYPPPHWRDTWLNGLLSTLPRDKQWMLVPPGVWLMIILAILTAAMLRYTRFGRHIFAIGSNEQTARLCGIAIERTKIMIYLVAGALVGVASVLDFSYVGIGDPTGRNGAELDIIAAVVIGGASLSGGQGSVLGSLIGALIMTAVGNGCTKLGLANWVQEIVTGAIIIAAVALDQLRSRRVA